MTMLSLDNEWSLKQWVDKLLPHKFTCVLSWHPKPLYHWWRAGNCYVVLITCVTKKKSPVLWGIPIDSGSWRPTEQSLCTDFSYHVRKGFFGHFRFRLPAISLLFFDLWWFQWKFLKFTQLLILSRRAPEMFSEFFIHIYTQKWGSKGRKRWFRNFSSWKARDLGRPVGREYGLKFFLGVPSHIRYNWWGSKLVHWLERRQNQINWSIKYSWKRPIYLHLQYLEASKNAKHS